MEFVWDRVEIIRTNILTGVDYNVCFLYILQQEFLEIIQAETKGVFQGNHFRLNYTSASNNEVTPFQLGIEWLTGVGPGHRYFKDNDDFAERMRSHGHIQKKY